MPLSAYKLATPIVEAVATAGTFTCFSPVRPGVWAAGNGRADTTDDPLGIADGVHALPLQITLLGTLRSSRGARRRVIMTAQARHRRQARRSLSAANLESSSRTAPASGPRPLR
jgi:hypothetical protein